MIPSARTHNDAVIGTLEAAGLTVGDGEDPTSPFGWAGVPGQSVFAPYVIVYPLSGELDGSLGCPDTDGDLSWQVTCVGSTREQCDWLLDTTVTALVGTGTLTVAGRSIPRVRLETPGGTRRDDSTDPALFIATPRFAAWTF